MADVCDEGYQLIDYSGVTFYYDGVAGFFGTSAIPLKICVKKEKSCVNEHGHNGAYPFIDIKHEDMEREYGNNISNRLHKINKRAIESTANYDESECVIKCSMDADCPTSNYTCTENKCVYSENNNNNSQGQVGMPCSTDNQCLSNYCDALLMTCSVSNQGAGSGSGSSGVSCSVDQDCASGICDINSYTCL